MRELIQYFSHLVSTLTASDVNNNLCIGVLCEGLLCNGLTRSEWTRNTSCTTFCKWEEEVQNTHTCYQRSIRCILLAVWTRCSYRPLLHHLNLSTVFENANGFCYIEITRFDALDNATHGWRNHNFVHNGFGFLNVSNNLSTFNCSAFFDDWFESPLLFEVKCISIDTTGNENTHDFLESRKWSLNTVVNLG